MDYSNSKIYIIRSNKTDKVYIGSTTQSLSKRLSYHIQDYKKWIRDPVKYHKTITSFEIIKYNDAYIELVEECPCENVEQLRRREGQIIRSIDCVNKIIAGRTMKEWREDHKEHLKNYSKEYNRKTYQERKEDLKVRTLKYYHENKESINEKRRQKYVQNKKKIRERGIKYYYKNREKIIQKNKEKYTCECGSTITKCNKLQHERSIKHQTYIQSQSN